MPVRRTFITGIGVVSPHGDDLDDVFDRVFAGGNDGKGHDIPYPFEALVRRIRGHIEPGLGGDPGVQQVLIPLGRSLQRFAAEPDFFKYPRVVVAVDGAPAILPAKESLYLKDRLFLGYQEKSNVIEVISYNSSITIGSRLIRFGFGILAIALCGTLALAGERTAGPSVEGSGLSLVSSQGGSDQIGPSFWWHLMQTARSAAETLGTSPGP